MPKLVYFPVQGRAQAIRYLLDVKGVQYENEIITGAEWGPRKAANEYGEGVQLPVWITDDGKVHNQSLAILKSLAMEHGYAPEIASVLFETEWFFAMLFDVFEKPERYALMNDDADEEAQDKCIALLSTVLDKLEARFADGRTSVGGTDNKTAADFYLLAIITSQYENENGKHERIRTATKAKLAECPNVNRVVDPMKELCRATIDALPASSL